MTAATKARRALRYLLPAVLLVGFFAVVIQQQNASLDWSRVRFMPAWAGLAFVLGLIQHLLASLLWCKVLADFGAAVRPGVAIKAYLIGDLGKYVPGKVWAVAGKAALVAREGVGLPLALTAATQETLLVLVSGALVALCYLGTTFNSVPAMGANFQLILLFVAVALLVAVHPATQRLMLRILSRLLRRDLIAIELSVRKTLILIFLYCGLWLLAGLAHICMFVALSAAPPPNWLLMSGIVSLGTIVGFAAVFAPGGLGVREATMASMLLPFASVELVAVFVILARVIVTCSQGLVTIIAALVINRVAADSGNPQPVFCQGPIGTSYPDHGEDRDL